MKLQRYAPARLLVHIPGMLPTPPRAFRGAFRTDIPAREAYSESAGIMRVVPLAVAVPDATEDLQALCAWASDRGVALIPRGSGSSMSGGAVGSGVVVDTHRFRAAAAVDRTWGRVSAGAALTRARIDEAAREHGLRFPVDPSSGAFATIGGMAATNAAGARSLRFGPTRRWVRALDCVWADGSRARVARGPFAAPPEGALARWQAVSTGIRTRCAALPHRSVRKDASGYGVHDFAASGELVDLLVGSEGTLAFFVGVELELAPLPGATASLMSSWAHLEAAVHGAALAREAGVAACEVLDESFLAIAARARTLPVAAGSACVLLVEVEGRDERSTHAVAEALTDAWRRAGASAVLLGLDPESEEALWSLRHAASPILARLDPHIRSMQVVEDGCVPPHRLADYVRGVHEALAAEGLEGVLFGHAGDAHLHVNALVDVRSPGWRGHVRALFDRVAGLTQRLGGTLTGEHGDGRLRTPELHRFWTAAAMGVFADIKAALDPAGILNPGVKVGPPADPFASIKYDPDTPLESPRAARVLERVEQARDYDSCRLELLEVTG